ncbi:diacylglycerol kinase family protein [Streptomyces sp. ISL-94]|uniref:diacylglycerol kinase family protein n=1 Tax=Streptomyces sp. ISL-94 TaxID=2819190 RepID=UPI001BE70978|nr:diacylglycerol kinase family protein [Streptomyces sp. ISL-94]MBT2482327.1 phosphatase PAP2 family protein [Streptomyces sp. ISL-94]
MRPERGAAERSGSLSVLLLLPVQAALMAGVGLMVTGPLAEQWPLAAEDGINRGLAAHRGGPATPFSDWLSLLAGTQSIIALTVLAVAAMLGLSRGRWLREAVFLAAAVAAQSAVFLLVTLVVERPRPHVPHLDAAPPTSSFPSGHVGASVALFGGLAVLVALRLRGARRWARYAVVAALLLIPVAVAFSRVYRGMHHPSDVVGGLLNGACALFVVAHALLLPVRSRPFADPASAAVPADRHPADRLPAARTTRDDDAVVRRAVVVRHPHGCGAELAERVRSVLRRHGYADQAWTATSAEDAAGGLAGRIAEEDTALVVVCGGDGTVRACADVLAGTGIPLAVVPCGTGNLLARNLRLPADPAAALEAALSGETALIDVGRVQGDGLGTARFTVMAGAGFDAAMVGDASERVKERLGWAAYVLSAVRHLGDPRMRLSIRLDEGPVRERRARMVVIGNVGTLQGGLPLLPDARPDSGRLEVVLLDPRGARGWLAAAGHLGARMLPGRAAAGSGGGHGRVAGGALEYFSAVRVEIRFARPQPRELDGDVFGAGTRLSAEVEPGALRIWLPPRAPGEQARTTAAGDAGRTERAAYTGGG